eukprot:TRINITY_DN20733_c0_g1::TRINITY_DN20733_c0_g1_i1::g.9135::m.9135 TRINITY_DN20733_c0_g1::TRINITY_DN20733_c0_g1_i1::g.9135  ORF type:complete len:183 (+),score=3.53,AsmA/PF05170.9/0.0017,Phlebovirus_G1/PF07243.6/0.1,DUF2393/PF09624.5/1,DUF2393/PF09624.5/6.1e+03 TRINITY_DN20733_c0_g1_i1:122-670(+)
MEEEGLFITLLYFTVKLILALITIITGTLILIICKYELILKYLFKDLISHVTDNRVNISAVHIGITPDYTRVTLSLSRIELKDPVTRTSLLIIAQVILHINLDLLLRQFQIEFYQIEIGGVFINVELSKDGILNWSSLINNWAVWPYRDANPDIAVHSMLALKALKSWWLQPIIEPIEVGPI